MVDTTENPQPSSDRLALLYDLTQTFTSTLDLDEVLNRVMDRVIESTRAERGFVLVVDENEQFKFQVARGMDQSTLTNPEYLVSKSIAESVARSGDPIITIDAQKDPRFMTSESVQVLGLRSILCVPVVLKGANLGVIYVDNHIKTGIFTHDDLELLNTIASSAAIAIENARLYQLAVEKGRLESELRMARQVQESLMSIESPELPGWEFVTRWLPARQVAGDFYDSYKFPGGKLGLVIADVADKGMPAALFMAITRTIVRASLDAASQPKEGIVRANRLVCADSTGSMFVTLFYALIDSTRSQITYVNAGQNPPLMLHRSSSGQPQISRLGRTGMALGIQKDNSYDQYTLKFFPGDFLVMYTDGVTDLVNSNQEEFGMDRLIQVVNEASRGTAEDMARSIEKALDKFSGGTVFTDDITLVIAKRR